MKKLMKAFLAAILACGSTACDSKITQKDRENLKQKTKEAEVWLKEKYGQNFRICKGDFSYVSGLFGSTPITDTLVFETEDGTRLLYIDEHFRDDYEADIITEALHEYFEDAIAQLPFAVAYTEEPVFNSYYVNETNFEGFYETKWNGNAEAFLASEAGNYTLGRMIVTLPSDNGESVETIDKQLKEKGMSAFAKEGMSWHKEAEALKEVLDPFGKPTFMVTIGYVSEENPQPESLRGGDRYAEHVSKVFSNGWRELYANRYYLGHDLFLFADEDNYLLKEGDVHIREVDMTLDDLEDLLKDHTFKEKPEHYTVLELTLGDDPLEVIHQKSGMNFFAMNIRGTKGTSIQIVNLERNEIRSAAWNYNPDRASLLYLYEKPVYLVIEE